MNILQRKIDDIERLIMNDRKKTLNHKIVLVPYDYQFFAHKIKSIFIDLNKEIIPEFPTDIELLSFIPAFFEPNTTPLNSIFSTSCNDKESLIPVTLEYGMFKNKIKT